MLSNYCCAQMSNFKRLRLLGHTLRQGYDVRTAYTFCTMCRRLYPDDNNYIFQQDSAPSHRCRLAQQFLQANTPDFSHSDAWPPNSPDLNLDPRAAELAAGRRPGKKCGLAAGKNAASRQPGRKKYTAQLQDKLRQAVTSTGKTSD